MNALKHLTISFFTLLLVLVSCTSDSNGGSKKVSVEQLNGKWSLTSAERNGQETGSLEGTFMQFSGDKMLCNFTGEEVNSTFTFENNEIIHGHQIYKIVQFTPSELITTTQLMGFDFKLTFSKEE